MTAGCRTSTYNPGSLARAELIATFAARRPVLSMLLDDVRRGGNQHHLLVGQRGAGKTTLLLRLAYAIDEDDELKARALPLRFPEEQYNVARPADFWLNCVDALSDALAEGGDVAAARKLDAEIDRLEDLDEEDRAREGLALLTGWAKQAGRLLVFLIDNLDLIFERLSGHHWALREVLSADNGLMLVGASSTFIREAFDYGEAFYDFFHVHELAPLTEDEARDLLEHLADATDTPRVRAVLKEPGRFAALHLLSGGMPRTLVLLHRILASDGSAGAEQDLEALLDQVTPYYKARFDELPAQSQVVMHALALNWHPMTAIECADRAHLDVNTASSQLNRLVRQGLVTKLASAESVKLSFLISERFFAIWYSMRASRRLRRKLLWLVEAVQALYGQPEVERRARELLSATGEPARLLAYASKVDDLALRAKLELHAAQAMVNAGFAGGPLEELDQAIARGEVPSLPDAADEHDLREIVARIAASFRANVGSDPEVAASDFPSAAARLILLTWISSNVAPYLRAAEDRAGVDQARRSRWLLEQGFRLLLEPGSTPPDQLVRVLAQPGFWLSIVRSGMAADAADAMREVGLHDRLLPIYEALRALVAGRVDNLLHLAPEVRTPTEQVLSSFIMTGVLTGFPYEDLVNDTSRDVDSKPSWLGSKVQAAATRVLSAAVSASVSAATARGVRASRKPRAKRDE